ncbi:MAG: protein kinase [Phycisphaerae bacterium]|nr:protein kinase [Phycisphaerae bacterium]
MTISGDQVRDVVERVLDLGIDPEVACRDSPELLPAVRERLDRLRELESEIDVLFPSGAHPRRDGSVLPSIPGYVVESVIGHGGMGVVYSALHLKLKRRVAIKMLLAGAYAGPAEIARFRREAESVAALCHPNIVQVFDAGECDGHPYFVMECMGRGTLADELRGEPQPVAAAARIVETLASAVQAAHVAGIVHRDLKPSNVLRADSGELKIADFGLAGRFGNDEASDVTIAGARLGTPSYMAPEQARGTAGAFCPLVDVYALGAILYELLTGRPPFRGASSAETTRLVLDADPVSPSRLNPSVPRDLETICLRALAKDPARRYPSAADLGDDLARWARGDAILARPEGHARRLLRVARRHPAATALTATLVVAALAALVLAERSRRHELERRSEAAIRRHDARQVMSSAIDQAPAFLDAERWADAEAAFVRARAEVEAAESPELASRLDVAWNELQVARELDRIRRTYPEPNAGGFSYEAAAKDYARLFEGFGIADGVSVEDAARRVGTSSLRDRLLRGLDSAAFVERVVGRDERIALYLDVARAADPHPWRDRFREARAWRERESLLALVDEASDAESGAEPHQVVIAAVLLSGLGENARTVEILKDAQARSPSDFWINLELGNALSREGASDDAAQFLRAAVAVQPSNYVAWAMLGHTLSTAGHRDDALTAHRRAVELAPECGAAWVNLAIAYSKLQRWDDAVAVVADARRRIGDGPELAHLAFHLRIAQAREAAARAEWGEALAAFDDVKTERAPGDTEVAFERAATALLAGDVATYRSQCEELLRGAEQGTERPFLAARAVVLAGDSDEALGRALQVADAELSGAADSHWAHAIHGAAAFRRGDLDVAASEFRTSLAASDGSGAAVVALAWLANVAAARGDAGLPTADAARLVSALGVAGASKPESMHLHDWLEAHAIQAEAARRRPRHAHQLPR